MADAHNKMMMSAECKHAMHNKCRSDKCWCACHPQPSSYGQSKSMDKRLKAMGTPATLTAYQTLDSGVLLDYQMDDEQHIHLRVGGSLRPEERPLVLTLSPADAVELIRILKELYAASPVDIELYNRLYKK